MSGSLPVLSQTHEPPILCAGCGHVASPTDLYCSACGCELSPTSNPLVKTIPIAVHTTQSFTNPQATKAFFDARANAILQFLPSGICISLTLLKPTVLGRGAPTDPNAFVDLTELGAVKCGVSRQHCQIRREGQRLILQDLGSTNHTFLNHYKLVPRRDYVVRHCDQVMIGTLELVVAFSNMD